MKPKEKAYSIALASTMMILFLILISSMASASSLVSEEGHNFTASEITDESGNISDDQVLSDEVSTEGNDIATESIQPAALKITETRITNSKSEQSDPVIYGNKIAWTDYRKGKGDIYMYDISTKKETLITTNGSDHYSPAIYGNKTAWMEWYANPVDSVEGGFYIKDLSTKKQSLIMTFSDFVGNPAIYGNKIVFEIYEVSWPDIYLYDISTKKLTQISNNPLGAYAPAIYGDRIVWTSYSDENYDAQIYMYDLSAKKQTQITTSGSASFPAIYGNRIVWEDDRNGNFDIYMYDLSTKKETQITTNPSASQNPAIYGNRIVWQDDRNGNLDIYMYDLSTKKETQITTNASNQEYPDIYDNKIVWQDDRNGNPDIYMGTLLTSPVAAFSASPTTGKAPLKVKFTDKSTGSPTSWKWSFGDGKTSTAKSPSYTYSKAGKYTVSLTVKNAAGSSTKTIKNYIAVNTLKAPIAAFSASPRSGKAPLKVQFTDKSTNSPTSWKWSFGDGTYSTAKSPAHKYSKAGKYTVSLTVKNAKGSNTKTISGYITVSKK
jgi:beta propeller repeat protein